MTAPVVVLPSLQSRPAGMNMLAFITLFPERRRHRWDIFEFIEALLAGDPGAWLALAAIAGCITFFWLYEKLTGRSFVKSRSQRREARRRRRKVLWEYRRDG